MAFSSDLSSGDLLGANRGVVAVMSAVARDAAVVRGLDDAALLELGRVAAEQRRLAEATVALVAGEVARRSDPALGKDGLARTSGYRTPEALVQHVTASSKHAANRDVRVGRILTGSGGDSSEDSGGGPTWLAPVRSAVLDGTISGEHATAIEQELGQAPPSIAGDVLSATATELVRIATVEHVDRVRELARELRQDLDQDGIAEREAALRAKRSLRLFRQDDGTTRLVWTMDPETAAVVTGIVDRATSPRLGGPRFVDPARGQAAEAIVADPRTTEQLASDVVRDLLAAGAAVDHTTGTGLLLQTEPVAVKILVTAEALNTGVGAGYLEGSGAEISLGTTERMACTGTVQHLVFTSSGIPIDIGREQRRFTRRQRELIAAKWGGCAIPWCDRPPTWTEYHHIRAWSDGGGTDADNGIPLCRSHHVDLHNNTWRLRHDRHGTLTLDIPGRADPIPIQPKSRAYRRLRNGAA